MAVEKICCTCCKSKSIADFYKTTTTKDGYYRRCKSCHAVSVKEWQEKNKGKHLENCRKWQKENPDKQRIALKTWRDRNKERYRNNEYEWRAKNSISIYARNNKRTNLQKQATPKWADPDKIALVYAEARKLNLTSGIKWHVDHVIPLVGKTVSGLHVAENLRIVTASVNLRKSNTFNL